MTDKKYRVILWGPGSIGSELLTAIIDHRDDLEIVGVTVYSDAKNGVDAGTLVGRDPIGVAATTDVDEIVALDADCVIYTPRNGDLDEVCRCWPAARTSPPPSSCSIRPGCPTPTGSGWRRPAARATARFTPAASTPATCRVSYRWRCPG